MHTHIHTENHTHVHMFTYIIVHSRSEKVYSWRETPPGNSASTKDTAYVCMCVCMCVCRYVRDSGNSASTKDCVCMYARVCVNVCMYVCMFVILAPLSE
jgi:hypothetical protein